MSVIGENLIINSLFVIPQESKLIHFQCVDIPPE